MQYAKELKRLLRPLGIYDLEQGIGAAELETVGEALDRIFARLEEAAADSLPLTAAESGLEKWEELLPYAPAGGRAEDRRNALIALLRAGGGAFAAEELNAVLSGCGIHAIVEETEEPLTVRVMFPGVRGEPENYKKLRGRIEQILPCQLQVTYMLVYLQWQELEGLFSAWAELDAAGLAWSELEMLGTEQ